MEYALRAGVALAAESEDRPVTAARLASAQDIPLNFLHTVLTELKRARLVRSTRGPDGGFVLARSAEEISVADIFRAIDGPLLTVRDRSLSNLGYVGPAADALQDLWMATRTSLRDVFEVTTLADLGSGRLPPSITELANRYREDRRYS
jgi:Rrf2 family protein